MNKFFNLQFFADAGTLVNATGNYVNAGTGTTTAFDGTNTLAPELKAFYDTELLETPRRTVLRASSARSSRFPRTTRDRSSGASGTPSRRPRS